MAEDRDDGDSRTDESGLDDPEGDELGRDDLGRDDPGGGDRWTDESGFDDPGRADRLTDEPEFDDLRPADARDERARTSDTFVNALVGAVVTVLVSFVPFSPIVGGAVAGYLEGGDGVRVGAISGLIAVIPLFFLAFTFLAIVGIVAIDVAVFLVFVGLFVFAFVVTYTVALSALGGFLGEYLADEYAARPR